jgi:hypothetical protein
MFAVILLPEFRLQAALRHRPELRGKAVALVEKQDAKGVILERTETAQSFGVVPEMAAVQALARCPHLEILPRAYAQEKCVKAALVETASSLSPDVEETADGYCTVDMRRGGVKDWQEFGDQIVERLRECGGRQTSPRRRTAQRLRSLDKSFVGNGRERPRDSFSSA